jgi:hypothetical protein
MKYLFLLIAFTLSGCSTTVPVTAKFPEVPGHLLIKCPQLNKLNDDAKLSDISKTITINYTEYYTCAVKNDSWIEWYQIQKKIFEGLK